MFERFTDGARRVVVLAQEEARLLGHGHIGTEHLVLGLMSDPEGGVRSVARQFDLRIEALRTELERLVGRGAGAPTSHIPFNPGAKKALELSLRAALRLGHNFIAAEHIMLGVLSNENELGSQLLVAQGPTAEQIRLALTDNITEPRAQLPDHPLRSPTPALLGCVHPDSALTSNAHRLPGPESTARRAVTVVRCRACGLALTVLDDPDGGVTPPETE